MTLEEFASFSTAKGWKCIGSNAYGTYRGYPFSLFHKPGKITSLTATFRLQKGLTGKPARALQKSLPKGCTLMQPVAGTMNLVCAGSDEVLEGNLREGMDAVTTALSEANLTPPDTCPYCKKKDCDALAAMGGGYAAGNVVRDNSAAVLGGAVGYAVARASSQASGYIPVHRACVMEKSADTVASAEKNLVVGSYGKGILGAVLGGLVAAIPSVLLAFFAQYSLALLYMLLPMGAWFGYKKLGGKQSKGAFWIVAVISLLHAFTIEVTTGYAFFVQITGLWPSLFAFIPYFFEIMGPGDLLADLLYPLVWLVVSLFAVRSQIGRTAHHDIQDASVAMESLASYTPRGSAEL